MKQIFRTILRAFGHDIVKYPVQGHVFLGHHLSKLLAKLDINCILDVGAHYGEYGLFLRNIGYRGRIISFEPVRKNFEILQERCKTDLGWTAQCLALGNKNDKVPMNITKRTSWSSFMAPSEYAKNRFTKSSTVERVENVHMKQLSTILEDIDTFDGSERIFLKMDTQGFDLMVLDGLGAAIKRILALQSELSVKPLYEKMPTYLEALKIFQEKGFELSGLFPVGIDENLAIIELDCVMVKSCADRL